MTNHYETLGISREADETEIKKAFRKLSLQHHPDRNPDADTTTKFQEINEAFEVLSDQEKREQYNMELQFGQQSPFGHPGMQQDMNDINNIFNMMFGGGGMPGMGGPGIRIFHNGGPGINVQTHMFHSFGRPEPIQTSVTISIEQSYHGCTVPVEFERWNVINNLRSNERDVLNLNLPRGIENGETIIVGDRGNNINNQVRGEVRITVHIKNESPFVRHGLDLVLSKKISLKESLCGFVLEFDHFNGKRICMNNTSGNNVIKPNSKKVINGLGMVRDNNAGNLIVEFDVQFPDTMSEEKRAMLRDIL